MVGSDAGGDRSWQNSTMDSILLFDACPLSSVCSRISRNLCRRAGAEAEVGQVDESRGWMRARDIAMRPHGAQGLDPM